MDSHSGLTPYCEVNFQLADAEQVLAAAEVEALVVPADVVYGEPEDGTFLGQRVLEARHDVLLSESLSPRGVSRGDGLPLGARQSYAVALLHHRQRLAFGEGRLFERREDAYLETSQHAVKEFTVKMIKHLKYPIDE